MTQRFVVVLAGLAFVAGAVVLYLDGQRSVPVPAARPGPVAAPASPPPAPSPTSAPPPAGAPPPESAPSAPPPTAPVPEAAEAAPRPTEPAANASPAAEPAAASTVPSAAHAPSAPPEPAAAPASPPPAAAEPVQPAPVVVHRPPERSETATSGPAARASAPSFDVVSVNPAGNAVIAGRAAPGSRVVLRDDETPIGEAVADAAGTFVIIPEQPLAPGARTLDLEAGAAGVAPGRSEDMVVVMVPETAETAVPVGAADAAASPPEPPQPVAVALPRQGPGAGTVLQPAGPDGALAIDTIDYDQAGHVTVAGRAPPRARIRLYLGETLVGDSSAGGSGRWTAAVEAAVPPGLYALRVDQVAGDGHVVARVEVPFDRRAIAAEPGRRAVVVIRRGNTLWHIARRTYGRGIDYTIIYAANTDQIRDPDLIYPGQVFTLPPPPDG